MSKRQIVIERVFQAAIEEVWELWTTRSGIEAWWGPDGFEVHVHELDLRPGGRLLYAMSASAPAQVAFMQDAGMPLTTEATITFTEVSPPSRLSYLHVADFIPGVEAYNVATSVALEPTDSGVRMVLTLDEMHDEEWTQRAVMGWESELDKLERVLSEKGASAEARL